MTRIAARAATETRRTDRLAPRYELEAWRREFGLAAGVTGRDGGFDLGLPPDAPTAPLLQRWRHLQDSLGPGFLGMAVSRQVHGAALHTHEAAPHGLLVRDGMDGHVTGVRGLALAVTVADCVPVYLAHPASSVLGLLHAGWRGVAAGVLEAGIERVCEVAQGSVEELVMHCGVAICASCYEVGPEVVEAVTGRQVAEPEGLDLRGVLAGRGADQGIRRISASTWCTAHDRDRFYSHRGSGGADGRMVAYLGRPLP